MEIFQLMPDSDTVIFKGFTVRKEFRRMAGIMQVYYMERKGVFTSTFELHGKPDHISFIKRWMKDFQRDLIEERRVYKLQRHERLRRLFHLETA